MREHGPGARLRLTGIEGELVVDDIYRKVPLPRSTGLATG